jgi:hypothetical protein
MIPQIDDTFRNIVIQTAAEAAIVFYYQTAPEIWPVVAVVWRIRLSESLKDDKLELVIQAKNLQLPAWSFLIS